MCNGALDRFCDVFLPCSFTDRKGRRCHNTKSGHAAKGHQDERGNIIGSSSYDYQSNFSSSSYQRKWIQQIKENLLSCDERLQQRYHSMGASQFKILRGNEAVQLHVEEQLKTFFAEAGGATHYTSMATCYCCLMNVPEHPLPCGHVLCTPCIKGYGVPLDHSSVRMDCCPLHPEESERIGPWIIHFKPDFAGIRVLSLDGCVILNPTTYLLNLANTFSGGIRGIIELEILRAIELALGGKIPIQRFFDLIVGTR